MAVCFFNFADITLLGPSTLLVTWFEHEHEAGSTTHLRSFYNFTRRSDHSIHSGVCELFRELLRN